MEKDKTINRPNPGDILSVNRGFYKHYGVYVGNDSVVHFSGGNGFEISQRKACIRKTTLEDFRKGGEIVIETRCRKSFSPNETVKRAMNALGTEKGKYSLPWNNCEHFANWCRYGEKKSIQVDQAVSGLIAVSALALGAVFINQIKDEF